MDEDELLKLYAAAHMEQHPGHDAMLGNNFFECFTCHDHVHQSGGHGYLVKHGRPGEPVTHIFPDQLPAYTGAQR